jgi:primosomal replication protein N
VLFRWLFLLGRVALRRCRPSGVQAAQYLLHHRLWQCQRCHQWPGRSVRVTSHTPGQRRIAAVF